MDSRITKLCTLLLNAPDCANVHSIAAELREALHDHIEQLPDQVIVVIPVKSDEPSA